MEWYHVYLFTRLDGINGLFVALSVVSVTVVIGAALAWAWNDDMSAYGEKYKSAAKLSASIAKKASVATLIVLLTTIAIPTQKEVAAIYLLPKLAKSEFASEASKIPVDAAKLLRLKLEQYIEDIDPVKEAEKK